jgi:multiple sugar transport system substrate-binding protein
MNSDELLRSRLTKRRLLTSVALAAGVPAIGALLDACSPPVPSTAPAVAPTSAAASAPAPTTAAAAPTAAAAAAPTKAAAAAAATTAPTPAAAANPGAGGPLKFVGWAYHPEIVEQNVNTFKSLYNEDVSYQLVPGEYHAIAETKLIGGEHFDMFYSEEDHLVRWMRASWIRDIDNLPGAKDMTKLMYPSNVKDITTLEGKLGGLPYYSGHNAFIYNELHTSQLTNFTPPTTWEEVTAVCKELKAKGISEYPYLSAWFRTWASLSWSLFTHWYSEGEPVFDDKFNPTFKDGGVAFQKVLEWHKMMFDQGLVQPDILTLQEEALPAYQTGTHTFMVLHDYDQKTMNDPKQSKAAGSVKNALMPGKTHETFIWTALYLMGAKPVDEARAWNLMQFFGGKAKDGQYHVAKRWALDFGLGTAWKEVVEDPEVVASWKTWRDLDVTTKQIATSRGRDISKALWFPEWDFYMMGAVQDYIQGKTEIGALIKDLYDQAVKLKNQYAE